jgi:PAS domain S-box-containing protein
LQYPASTDRLMKDNRFVSDFLENIPVILMLINPDNSIRYVNSAFQRQTGYSPQEIIAKPAPYPWWAGKNRPKQLQKLLPGLKRRINQRETAFTTREGEKKWFEVTCLPFESGDSGGLSLLTAVDITESRELRDNLQAYITHVTRLRESEHERIARQLHEEILQSLAALNLSLDSVVRGHQQMPETLVSQLIELQAKINAVIDETRSLSHELKSGILDYLGLVKALETLTEDAGNEKAIKVGFNVTGTERPLPSIIRNTLFLIAQEALKNAQTHSQASQINVDLQFSPGKVGLTIADNGKGFQVPERLLSYANLGKIGLINMENWNILLKGKLRVRSKPRSGTTVSVEVKI